MEVKDVEIVLLNERIAMQVESNLYLDSQEEQIAVEVEATTPKTSPPVSSMIKRVKNRETRKEHKDLDFWYITKRQPKQNKTVDEVEPVVEESAKTRKEEHTQHQHPTKQIDTSYLRKVIEKYLQHHNPKLIEGNKFHEETEIAMNCPQQVDHSYIEFGSMKSSECRDKQIMELSGSKDKASFNFFNPDEESDEEFDPHPSYGFRPNSSSMDYIDSVKVTREKVGMKFVSEINQTIKEHFENLLHVVDGLSARLSQLESKTHQLENAVDDLKVSAEYNSGRTDGKLRQLENILREVQDDIHFLRDRQEIAETQLQLAKLQVSKSNRQSEDQKTAPVQADSSLKALPSVSEQSSQPCPNAPSTILHQNAKPAGAPLAMDLHTQIAPNPIPSTPQPQSYYLPTGNILESTYQQYNVPPAQHEQPPPPVPSQLYQPASNLPQVSKSPEQAQLHPPPWTPPPPVPSQLYQPTSSLPQVPQSPELPQLHPPPWNPPPPVPSQLYQPTSNLPQVSQSPELPQLHPRPWTPPPPVPSQLCQPPSNLPPVSQSPQTQPPWMSHHPEESPSMPSHNYQPPGGPSMQQFYMDSSQRMPEQPSSSEFLC
ncbi:hypothetical protein TEA_002286 [Camellia sinensis var. sinensis]|uniref:DUF1421 domain-containing protein n=1 Tax=Camellia sinensis var. sinensis TaxID=542762 RepID=A0A4S4EVX2_CAMSN|nr:hypothetical protein TEA_002286 [Camellia sinensis var. sinensis]